MKIRDYLIMLRIGDWIKFYMTAPIAGAIVANASRGEVILVVIIYFAIISFAFTVNNYFDVDIDRKHNGKVKSNKNPLASGNIDSKGVQMIMFVQIAISLISIGLSRLGFFLVVFNIFLVGSYSGIFRLKEKFTLDIITHGLMFGAVPFLAGYALCKDFIPQDVYILSIIPLILGVEALIAHQILEYEEDVISTRTTVTIIGKQNGLLLLGTIAAISISVLYYVVNIRLLPLWVAVVIGCYLLTYPAYSCRSIFRDFRHTSSTQ
jgi:4-hydroxybenzoate polyprenyltransferase